MARWAHSCRSSGVLARVNPDGLLHGRCARRVEAAPAAVRARNGAAAARVGNLACLMFEQFGAGPAVGARKRLGAGGLLQRLVGAQVLHCPLRGSSSSSH